MGKGLRNPNSVKALQEMKMEIANELGIQDYKEEITEDNQESNSRIHERLAERSKNNLIGFK